MKRYLLLLSLVFFCFVSLFAQSNNTNQAPVNDTLQKKKELAPAPGNEVAIPASNSVKLKSSKSLIDSKLRDEPASADSQVQSQASYFINNFQTVSIQSKNNVYQRSPSEANQKKLDASANYFKSTFPSGFEANFMTYRAGNYDQSNYSNLESALKLQPNNSEVQVEFGLANFIQNNNEIVDSITTCLVDKGYFSEGIMNYTADMIQSIPTNSTLIVHGTADLLPLIKAKSNFGRSDLQIIGLDLLQSEQYQMELTGMGYVIPENKIIDTAYVRNFCELNQGKNLFLGMGFPKTYLEGIQADLTVIGLSLGYKINGLDAYNWNLNLYRFVWNTKQLGINQDLRSNTLSSNYLPALMNLQKQFEWYKRNKDYEEITALINAIGLRSKKTKTIQSIGK